MDEKVLTVIWVLDWIALPLHNSKIRLNSEERSWMSFQGQLPYPSDGLSFSFSHIQNYLIFSQRTNGLLFRVQKGVFWTWLSCRSCCHCLWYPLCVTHSHKRDLKSPGADTSYRQRSAAHNPCVLHLALTVQLTVTFLSFKIQSWDNRYG